MNENIARVTPHARNFLKTAPRPHDQLHRKRTNPQHKSNAHCLDAKCFSEEKEPKRVISCIVALFIIGSAYKRNNWCTILFLYVSTGLWKHAFVYFATNSFTVRLWGMCQHPFWSLLPGAPEAPANERPSSGKMTLSFVGQRFSRQNLCSRCSCMCCISGISKTAIFSVSVSPSFDHILVLGVFQFWLAITRVTQLFNDFIVAAPRFVQIGHHNKDGTLFPVC